MLAQTQAGQCPRPPGLQSQAGPRDPAAIVTAGGGSMALRQAGAHKFYKLHKLGRGRPPPNLPLAGGGTARRLGQDPAQTHVLPVKYASPNAPSPFFRGRLGGGISITRRRDASAMAPRA